MWMLARADEVIDARHQVSGSEATSLAPQPTDPLTGRMNGRRCTPP